MADQDENLPEGTDKIIAGASTTRPEPLPADEALVVVEADSGSEPGGNRVMDRVRSGRDKLSGQAADKARGLVAQGIERSAEALANVSKLVGDTATGLDERLGEEYGDYARSAAERIEGAANSLAAKDADELIDDTREFVKRSPGVALAGAAIVGFALARLIKTGLGSDDDDSGGRRKA
jgi:hypothetical protein